MVVRGWVWVCLLESDVAERWVAPVGVEKALDVLEERDLASGLGSGMCADGKPGLECCVEALGDRQPVRGRHAKLPSDQIPEPSVPPRRESLSATAVCRGERRLRPRAHAPVLATR